MTNCVQEINQIDWLLIIINRQLVFFRQINRTRILKENQTKKNQQKKYIEIYIPDQKSNDVWQMGRLMAN